jgi:hypothetical protein
MFQLFALTVSALIAGLGLYGLARPHGLAAFASLWRTWTALWLAVGLRLAFGIALWNVAPISQAPMVLRVIGLLSMGAAIVLPMLGIERLRTLLDGWTRQSTAFLRTWSAAAALAGAFLLWAVLG